MTMPGRAVKIVMRQRLAARSIRIRGTDADSSFFLSNPRIARSSPSSLPNSFFPAYHFERQSLVTATRRPTGLVFCPIGQKLSDGVMLSGNSPPLRRSKTPTFPLLGFGRVVLFIG